MKRLVPVVKALFPPRATPAAARGQDGFTLVELTVTLVVFMIIALSFLGLFTSLVHSTIIAKRQATALSLATNQMEYLKSLPYDSLAVSGGSIYSTNPLPATTTKTLDGVTYTITTSIGYVDDAYDGCGSYPNQTLKQQYCRNYPPPSGAPATDLNSADYKIAHVDVVDNTGTHLASVDTQIAARVAETASTTGAIFVSVIDESGTPVSGATVSIADTGLSPNVNVSDSTDSNGVALFYSLPPDSSNRYVVTATKSGYSSLTTIAASGSLQPTYPNLKILTQQSSYVTLTIMKQGTYSLLAEAVDTSGNPLASLKLYAKGGYKKYTSTADTSYYFDTMSPSDTRPVTDSDGLAALQNLVPGPYYFCGDTGATNCKIGTTTYYLVAALPYSGDTPFSPITVPTYDPDNPPATTYAYGGNSYIQKVRLIFSTNANYPRVFAVTPSSESKTDPNISSFSFSVTGANLPCSSSPASCSTTVQILQGGSTITASCAGTTGTALDCTADLSSLTTGTTQLQVSAGGNTLTMPVSPPLGGITIAP